MRIGELYVGLGEGDRSPEVRKVKAKLRDKFTPARNTLDDGTGPDDGIGPLFTPALTAEVRRVQAVYRSERKPGADKYIDGVINVEFKYDVGLLARPEKPKPIVFTVEGHMSNPWNGPCAYTASALEQQGLCWWQPVHYDTQALPFNNASGVRAFDALLNRTELDDGRGGKRPFPAGTPWGMIIFSQGGIVGCKQFIAMRRQNHWRLNDLKAVVAYGNPYREKDVIAPWVPDPPKAGTQGISDTRMTDTPEYWREHARHGDMYAENPDNEVGLNRSAIYKIVAESSWSGGPAGLLDRVIDLMQDPTDGVLDIAKAIIGGAMFLGNMGPHGIYDLGPDTDFMRDRLHY